MISPALNEVLKKTSHSYNYSSLNFEDKWMSAFTSDYEYETYDGKTIKINGFPDYFDSEFEVQKYAPKFNELAAAVKAAWEFFLTHAANIADESPNDEYMRQQWEDNYTDDYDTFEDFDNSSTYWEIFNDDQQLSWNDFRDDENWSAFLKILDVTGQELVDSYNNVLKRQILGQLDEAATDMRKMMKDFNIYDYLKEAEYEDFLQEIIATKAQLFSVEQHWAILIAFNL
jgi:hypothetical protein